jgi:hypothetical protein
VKRARPPLAQVPKGRAGGRSGLHRAAQQLTAVRREPRIRATETSRAGAPRAGCSARGRLPSRPPGGASRPARVQARTGSHPDRGQAPVRVKRAISARSNTK